MSLKATIFQKKYCFPGIELKLRVYSTYSLFHLINSGDLWAEVLPYFVMKRRSPTSYFFFLPEERRWAWIQSELDRWWNEIFWLMSQVHLFWVYLIHHTWKHSHSIMPELSLFIDSSMRKRVIETELLFSTILVSFNKRVFFLSWKSYQDAWSWSKNTTFSCEDRWDTMENVRFISNKEDTENTLLFLKNHIIHWWLYSQRVKNKHMAPLASLLT